MDADIREGGTSICLHTTVGAFIHRCINNVFPRRIYVKNYAFLPISYSFCKKPYVIGENGDHS